MAEPEKQKKKRSMKELIKAAKAKGIQIRNEDIRLDDCFKISTRRLQGSGRESRP